MSDKLEPGTVDTEVWEPVPAQPAQTELVTQQQTDRSGLATRQDEYLTTLTQVPLGYQAWLATLSPKKAQRVRNSVNRMTHGLHAVAPLTCTGPQGCPFLQACPLVTHEDGKPVVPPDWEFPVGHQCILEGEYMVQKIGEYFVYLDVDPRNPIERSIVQELSLIDLQKNRALLILSHGDKEGQGRDFMHVDSSITGFSDDGTPLVSQTTKIHPVLEYIDKLERRREKWLDKLMETRKAKADWAHKMGNNQEESKILTEITEMRKVVATMLQQGAAESPILTIDVDDDDEGIGLDEGI